MELNFEWKENKGQYQSGETLYLNKIIVASYGWNSATSKADPDREDKKYSGRINLPSLKDNTRYGNTQEIVKTKIEITVKNWFKEALAPNQIV